MAKYRKKPITIDAVQIFMHNESEWPKTVRLSAFTGVGLEVFDYLHNTWVKFNEGDWIITGVENETYPCVQSVFETTYELVEPNALELGAAARAVGPETEY